MSNKLQPALVIVFLAIILILLDSSGRIEFLTFPLRKVLAPFQYLADNIHNTVLGPVNYYQFVQAGEQRIKELEKRNLVLVSEDEEVKRLKSENEDLRKQLGVQTSKSTILESANVLGINRYLEFEVENNSQIKEGQSVIYLDNYLGTVTKIGFGIGFSRLVADPDSKIPAKTDSATGIIIGEFSSGLTLDKVGKEQTLNVGDLVTTSGIDGITKPDLIIGKIEKITSSPNDLFQKASVKPLVDPRGLKLIYIVIN